MKNDNKKNQSEFNGRNERQNMQQEHQQEESANNETRVGNDLSLGNSERNFGDVNGSTFGMDSNTAKFSNVGEKNQSRKGEMNNNMGNPNNPDNSSTPSNGNQNTRKSNPERRTGGYDGL
jgi:hypothetical protein